MVKPMPPRIPTTSRCLSAMPVGHDARPNLMPSCKQASVSNAKSAQCERRATIAQTHQRKGDNAKRFADNEAERDALRHGGAEERRQRRGCKRNSSVCQGKHRHDKQRRPWRERVVHAVQNRLAVRRACSHGRRWQRHGGHNAGNIGVDAATEKAVPERHAGEHVQRQVGVTSAARKRKQPGADCKGGSQVWKGQRASEAVQRGASQSRMQHATRRGYLQHSNNCDCAQVIDGGQSEEERLSAAWHSALEKVEDAHGKRDIGGHGNSPARG